VSSDVHSWFNECHCSSRRRLPSPESPHPYISFRQSTDSLFPMTDGDPLPLRIDELPNYIHRFNQSNKSKLHIWSRSRGPVQLSNPTILRFTIRNVLTAYATLGYGNHDPTLVVESITTFSPQEKVSYGKGSLITPLTPDIEVTPLPVRLRRVPEPLAADRDDATI
jgi:hypothetical protein